MLAEHILILAICGLGVFHGISLGTYLMVGATANSLPNKLLGALLAVFGLRISKSIFLYFTSDLDIMLVMLGLTLILSFGPLFFLYVRSLLENDFKLARKHLLHAVPFILFLTLTSLGIVDKTFYMPFGILFIYLHFLAYIIISFAWQRKFRRSNPISNNQSAGKWINYIHLGMAFIWLSYFMFLLDEIVPYIAGPITYSLVIYPLSFWAIIKKVHKPEEKKYQNSRLDNTASLQVISKLEAHIKEEKRFLNPDLKLPMVATELNTTPHVLSQAVNENFGQNFQQYLNGYRVKAAQEMLERQEKSHLTIASIAFDSGFNSLSAFNTSFKKVLQKTPSQYRKEQVGVTS
ncbi:MAG: AraC family transcriptional regulator [Roseivirga sp.]|nr:AraC family transcriptional regulator [Roseivirga sp.]